MPDTGAPWNIPYVAGTDLVADWPTDSQTLAEAIADGLDVALLPGIGANVVSAVKTDTYTLTSNTYTSVPDLTVTITPSTNTSKVLLIAMVSLAAGANTAATVQLERGGTSLLVSAGGSPTGNTVARHMSSANDQLTADTYVAAYLDSPATTSATTYTVQVRGVSGSTAYINRGSSTSRPDSTSSLTAIEVSA